MTTASWKWCKASPKRQAYNIRTPVWKCSRPMAPTTASCFFRRSFSVLMGMRLLLNRPGNYAARGVPEGMASIEKLIGYNNLNFNNLTTYSNVIGYSKTAPGAVQACGTKALPTANCLV